MLPTKFQLWKSPVKIAHFVPIRVQTWPPQAILVSDWPIFKNLLSSETAWPDASYQVSVHLAKGFQRRRLKCKKLTDNGRQVMTKTHIAFGKVS
jgi:hypothetical protein